jgi:hypothetical protein
MGVKQHRPQPQQRPVGFAFRMLGLVTAQLAASESLLEMPEKQFNAPPPTVNLGHLPITQALGA